MMEAGNVALVLLLAALALGAACCRSFAHWYRPPEVASSG